MKQYKRLDPRKHSGVDFWALGCDLEKTHPQAPEFVEVLVGHATHYDEYEHAYHKTAYENGVAFGRELKGKAS